LLEAIDEAIKVEMKLIERLLAEFDDLLCRVQQQQPNRVEITALASVLHAFYNGLESIFQFVAKNLDDQIPAGHKWHMDLLNRMACATKHRPALLSAPTASLLKEYLSFRHFFRHSYTFFLDWNKFSTLALALPSTWQQVKRDLEAFLQTIAPTAE
jgi:hypothetical protein